jgi:hypothetical protein
MRYLEAEVAAEGRKGLGAARALREAAASEPRR